MRKGSILSNTRHIWAAVVFPILYMWSCSNEPIEAAQTADVLTPDPFAGDVAWETTFGGSSTDEAVAIAKGSDTGYVIAGTTNSVDGDITDKTATDKDYWLLKISDEGNVLWSRTFGGSEDDIATNISSTSDGGYIVSGYSRSVDGDVSGNEGFQDYWILKLDAQGQKMWDQNFGFSGSDQAFNVFQTSDGGYFATGFLDVSASGGGGNDDRSRSALHGVGEYWAIKMDASGAFEWRRYFGGSNNDRSSSAIQTSSGDFILVGSSESNDFDITDSKGSYDYWAVKVSANGDLIWTQSFGGEGIDNGYGIAPTSDGHFVFIGDTRSTDQDVSSPMGNADIWMVKFDSNTGQMIWDKSIGGSDFDTSRAIVRTNEGYAIAGSTRSADGDISQNYGNNDAWLVVTDAQGEVTYERSFGGSNFDFAANVLYDQVSGAILWVGNTESNDNDVTINKGGKDFFVVKIE